MIFTSGCEKEVCKNWSVFKFVFLEQRKSVESVSESSFVMDTQYCFIMFISSNNYHFVVSSIINGFFENIFFFGQNFQTKASQAQFHIRAFQVLFLTISVSFATSFLKLKKRLWERSLRVIWTKHFYQAGKKQLIAVILKKRFYPLSGILCTCILASFALARWNRYYS